MKFKDKFKIYNIVISYLIKYKFIIIILLFLNKKYMYILDSVKKVYYLIRAIIINRMSIRRLDCNQIDKFNMTVNILTHNLIPTITHMIPFPLEYNDFKWNFGCYLKS